MQFKICRVKRKKIIWCQPISLMLHSFYLFFFFFLFPVKTIWLALIYNLIPDSFALLSQNCLQCNNVILRNKKKGLPSLNELARPLLGSGGGEDTACWQSHSPVMRGNKASSSSLILLLRHTTHTSLLLEHDNNAEMLALTLVWWALYLQPVFTPVWQISRYQHWL